MGEIDADADGQPAGPTLQQQAGQLLALSQHVIGPFNRDAGGGGEVRRHLGRRQRGSEGQLPGDALRRGGPQQQGRRQIARPGIPGPAAPAPARTLARGGDPERTVLRTTSQGKPARFLIGGIDLVIVLPAVTGRPEDQGISAFAAASAAVITGEAATTKSSATTMDTTRIARLPMPETGSNASTGSSKNISFTRRR